MFARQSLIWQRPLCLRAAAAKLSATARSKTLFKFKHFNVEQDKVAQRVGTDSMLLGSWAEPLASQRILDVGCGCGVLGLMMAQKTQACGAEVDMIDIDAAACEQAKGNAAACGWGQRMRVRHMSLQALAEEVNGADEQQEDSVSSISVSSSSGNSARGGDALPSTSEAHDQHQHHVHTSA